jgi:hypothetical protein
MRLLRYIFLLLLVFIFVPSVNSRTEFSFIGQNIPTKVPINASGIFHNSDSLFINGDKLVRDTHYRINNNRQVIEFIDFKPTDTDTLLVIFNPYPQWIKKSYGTGLPEVVLTPYETTYPELTANNNIDRKDESNIIFSGAKTFRVNSKGDGNSAFSQSLDLNISGFIAEGLELDGAVSDRDFNSSYGTSNSRINELDKINLNLKSKHLNMNIGDILAVRKDRFGSSEDQRVSGVSFQLSYPKWNINGTAARPKGRFESTQFLGENNNQGPYQISQSSQFRSIVPSSETIWLNGQKLQRGADKDYIIDYPTGWITFNVNRPIDSRSRIDVDYEPLLNDYQKELFKTGGGVVVGDSILLLNIGWTRDGDNQDDFLEGSLSDNDKLILSSVGDSIEQAFRSGAKLDSTGNYLLAIDSVGNQFYQYTGLQNGDYSVRFTFVGQGKGDYRFLGSDHYRYVGIDSGDYLPIIIINAPERTEYFTGEFIINGKNVGIIEGEFQKSKLDRNLLSDIDDDDNSSDFYDFRWHKSWIGSEEKNYFKARRMYRGKGFHNLIRVNRNDLNYQYMLPRILFTDVKQEINEFESDLFLSNKLSFKPFYSNLKYANKINSKRYGTGISLNLSNYFTVLSSYRKIETEFQSTNLTKGEGQNYSFGIDYQINSKNNLRSYVEHDKRTNNFIGSIQGTRYDKLLLELFKNHEKVSYEFFKEDSLVEDWINILKRHRVSASSSRKLGQFDYQAILSYQNIKTTDINDNSILGRFKFSYRNQRKKLSVRSSYLLSDETKNSRGISYLEVPEGEGNFIFEDDVYIPDENGNFIRLEEILSEKAKVKKGERSFSISKNWSNVVFRFDSRLNEELLDNNKREWWWVVPFIPSKADQLFFLNKRYNAVIRLFPVSGGHKVNLSFDEFAEFRSIANQLRKRTDRTFGVILKQSHQSSFFEESFELYKNNRDIYFIGSGNIKGVKGSFKYKLRFDNIELSAKSTYQRAKDEQSSKSKIISFELGSKWRFVQQGELRSSVEFYRQTSNDIFGSRDFLLTGNRPGKEGMIWSVATRQNLKKKMRFNLSISGRHNDIRTARITGRGELIAEF